MHWTQLLPCVCLQLQTAWHDAFEEQVFKPVASEAVRRSPFFDVNVSLVGQAKLCLRSFVYASIPRSGARKLGYSEPDGAEYAAKANITMSWTQFIYGNDTWVTVTRKLGGHNQTVLIRPRRLAATLQTKWDGGNFKLKIPFKRDGFRISVEFQEEIFATWNTMTDCCNLTDHPGPGYRFVHAQPRNALLIFAEPRLTSSEAAEFDPTQAPDVNPSNIAYAPPGDVRSFLNSTTADVLYFRPGIYYMGSHFSAQLRSVRWVHLAAGAYVKGAVAFLGDGEELGAAAGKGKAVQVQFKVTGFGVLSGEQYVWSADPSRDYAHSDGGYGQLKMLRLQCGPTCARLDVHGPTLSEPPFYAFVAYGDASPSEGLQVHVARYKQVGGWYWETSGIELGSQGEGAWGRGTLRDSFMHCNDDCLILWHSNSSVSNVAIWGGTNGAHIQLGWKPLALRNILVDGIDVVHNLQGWADDKPNGCVINAAPPLPGVAVEPRLTATNMTLRNIAVEGAALCAMRIAVMMTYQSLAVENIAVDAWNGLSPESQRSSYYQADWNNFVTPAKHALVLRNYSVAGEIITRAAGNWQANSVGRLNFSSNMWDYWTAV